MYKLTCNDEYAIRAFKVNGVDYLLKPIENEELKRAIDKCRVIVESRTLYPSGIQDFLRSIASGKVSGLPQYKECLIIWIHYSFASASAFALFLIPPPSPSPPP